MAYSRTAGTHGAFRLRLHNPVPQYDSMHFSTPENLNPVAISTQYRIRCLVFRITSYQFMDVQEVPINPVEEVSRFSLRIHLDSECRSLWW